METIVIEDISKIDQAAQKFKELLLSRYSDCHCIVFYGGMGAGKTTFIKAFCRSLGVEDNVSSPTFAIVNEYLTAKGTRLFHFDLYRIKDLEEAMSAGAEDYLYGDGISLIEWPEVIEPILPPDTLKVTITADNDHQRTVNIETF
ncbi:MAG: tRNA (adenosine(37)-N6)-threonylcarbamoyltransferase complex ATPase subunit type 1 TsaE [Bacteroidales bacterium]|nr:tRNA (adenosine(37)-N6)-threonylcarbamoyltransferase complex ATPase subunit type 1 TsaE [Bacteroidales bacterium]